MRRIVLILMLPIAVFALAASGESSSSSGDDAKSKGDAKTSSAGAADEVDDVKITSCAPNSLNFPEAKLDVTNNSGGPSNYIITIAFESEDGKTKFDDGMAFVNNVGVDQTAKETASGLTEIPEKFVCKVSEVERMAAT